MAWITGNRALNTAEMENNAEEVWDFFKSRGFTLESVCGMLGNMWRESNVNPGVWQSYKVNYRMGYGLVQWTPATNVTNWLKQNGFPLDSGEGQCQRIIFEKENGLQYYKTKSYPLSFSQFASSTESVEYLVRTFFANYERGKASSAAMDDRIKWGVYFYNYLKDGSTSDPPPEEPPDSSEKEDGARMRRKTMWVTIKRRRLEDGYIG